MLDYIKELFRQLLSDEHKNFGPIQEQVRQVLREIERLEPGDFDPAVQAQFVTLRGRLAHYARVSSFTVHVMKEEVRKGLETLDHYRGPGSGGKKRTFAYLADPKLIQIIERDYEELTLRLFPGGAWKNTVIMAGSILEAILHDVLSNPKRVAQTNASTKGARGPGGVPIDIITGAEQWKLIHLINVAADIGLLPKEREKAIDQVLRDYRNFVHPKVEVRSKHPCTQAEAMMSVGALEAVCNHFDVTL